MFQFGGFPTYTYVFSIRFIALRYESFLIRISADRGSFAAPRSFSQLVTSFFGAMYQGIHLYALCSLIFLDCFFAIRRIFLPQRILILRFSANFLSVKLAGYFLRFQFVIVLTFALFVQLASNFFCFLFAFCTISFFPLQKNYLCSCQSSCAFRRSNGFADILSDWWAQMDSNHRPHAYQACALTSWAMSPCGGDERDRTADPLLARQVLSQLSYTPINHKQSRPEIWCLNIVSNSAFFVNRFIPLF